MAIGIFGSKRLSDCTSDDVDVLYSYSPNRDTMSTAQMLPLFNNVTSSEFIKMLGADGAYQLRLPATVFNQLGFYIILVKPKSYETQITDCSFIVSQSDTDIQVSKKGIVIPKLQFQNSGGLVGYQIEYFDDNGVKIKNFHRIITSSDLVSIASNSSQSLPSSSQSYVLDDNGSLLFLTLTPDEASIVSNLKVADLGRANQKILVSNTFFDAVMIEVEMVDQTIKTLGYGIFGNSMRDLETGVYSVFDANNNLFKQYNLLTRKKTFSNGEIDIKEERTVINFNQNFFNLSQQNI